MLNLFLFNKSIIFIYNIINSSILQRKPNIMTKESFQNKSKKYKLNNLLQSIALNNSLSLKSVFSLREVLFSLEDFQEFLLGLVLSEFSSESSGESGSQLLGEFV